MCDKRIKLFKIFFSISLRFCSSCGKSVETHPRATGLIDTTWISFAEQSNASAEGGVAIKEQEQPSLFANNAQITVYMLLPMSLL